MEFDEVLGVLSGRFIAFLGAWSKLYVDECTDAFVVFLENGNQHPLSFGLFSKE